MGKRAKAQSVSLPVARAVLASSLVGDNNLGIDGGEFVNRLIRTITAADKENRDRLAKIYPEHVAAVNAVQHETWGLDWLRRIAREDVA